MDPDRAVSDWDRCAGWIEAALEHSVGGWTLDDVREAVERGEAQLWAGERSAHVTQIETYPFGKAIEVLASGGDMDELIDVLRPQIEAWAKAQGCVAAHVVGRLGWARQLKSCGYEPLYTVIRKELV